MKTIMSKLLRCFVIPAVLALAIGSIAKAGTIYWVDWQTTETVGGVTKYVGKMTVVRPSPLPAMTITVKYTPPPSGIAFFQASGGTDYWTNGFFSTTRNPATSPYTSSVVDNIPTGTDIIGLRYAGQNQLEFFDSVGNPIQVASPVFAYVSLNGNGYGFDKDFDILSYGDPATGNDIGYWGTGTSFKNVTVVGGSTQYQLLGTGEPHGALQFRGAFSVVKWQSLSDEYWNGFTIGVAALADDIPIANAGPDQTVMADNNCNGIVQLSGSASGSTHTPYTYSWTGPFGTATGPSPIVTLPVGTHTITLTVTDSVGTSDTDTVIVTVVRGTTFSQAVPDAFPGVDFMTCIMGNFQLPTHSQHWKVRLRSSALETVVLRVAATTVNTSETGSMVATITDATGPRTLTVTHPATQTDNLGTISLQLQGGTIYDLAIQRTGQAAHYKLGSPDKRLEIGFSSPILYLEHEEQAWVVNAAPNEVVNLSVQKDSPAIDGADPQATSMTYSVRRADCTSVVPTTTISVPGTISFNAGPTGGAFVVYMDPNGHFSLLKNSGCDVGFYALPCAPHVQIVCPANIVKSNDPGRCGAVANFSATATGACVGPISYSVAPGSLFPKGTTPVVASVTDMYGQTASCTFTVTVNDTEPPVIACPANVTAGTDPGKCSAVVTLPPATATDNCGAATVTYLGVPPGSVFPKGTTTVTAVATDGSGNTAQCTFTVTVNDTEAPALTLNAVNGSLTSLGPVKTFITSVPGSTSGGIRHAHGIAYDLQRNTVWVTDTENNNDIFEFPATQADGSTVAQLTRFHPPGTTTIEGIYFDPTDNTLWYIEINGTIHHIDRTGAALSGGFSVAGTVPAGTFGAVGLGIAIQGNFVWVDNGQHAYKFNKTGSYTGFSFTTGSPGITYDPERNLLWTSNWNDAFNGAIHHAFRAYDPTTGNQVFSFTINPMPNGDRRGHDVSIGAGRIWVATEEPFTGTNTNVPELIYSVDINGGAIDKIIECSQPFVDPGYVATDNCGPVTVQVTTPPITGVGTYTITYTAVDSSGNTTTKTRTVTVLDTTPPTVTCPGNLTAGTDADKCAATVAYNVTASDSCGSVDLVLTASGATTGSVSATGGLFNKGVTTVTVVARDSHNNTATCAFTVTVKDTTPPVITCPGNITVGTDAGKCTAVVALPAATATDNCGAAAVTYVGVPAGSVFPLGTTSIKAVATDLAGNTAECTFTVTVKDTEAPRIACPANIAVGTDPGRCTAAVTFAATATDNCGAVTIDYSIAPGSAFALGTTTVTATATDAAGNKSSCSFTVTVTDTEAPKIACPANIAVGTDLGKCTAAVPFAATATDNCGAVTIDYSIAPGSAFALGTTTVTATATDAAGNKSACSFTVTVTDTEAPKIACPANVAVGTDLGKCTAAVTFAATATDNCGNPTIEYSMPSGFAFPLGTTTVTATATDATGNKTSCTFTVTVKDTEAPKIVCPANVTSSTDAGKCTAVVALPAASATDNCGAATVTYVGVPAGSVFPLGTTTIKAIATDGAGNTSECSFTVTVNDTEAPKVACPADISVGTDAGKCTAAVTYAATATDNCGAVTLSYSVLPGSPFPLGTTSVLVTATDAAGNKSTCTFKVTVKDTEAPKIACPANVSVGTDAGKCTAAVAFAATATDNCGAVALSYSLPSGYAFPLGTTTVTATATDAAGNSTACTFTVTVKDTEAPKIACPANLTVGNDAGKCSAVVNFAATATDNCTGAVTIVYSIAPGSVFPKGTTLVTATATDAAGNTASCTFTVTVKDTEAPTGYCVPTTNPSGNNVPNAGNNPKSGQNPDGFYQLSGKDNCDAPSALGIYVKDSASNFIAGPFKSGDKVKITQAPGVTPDSKPMAGDIVAHIQLKGDALVLAVDTAGNSSVVASCLVAPAPK